MSLGSALGYSITILEIAVIVIAFRKKLPRALKYSSLSPIFIWRGCLFLFLEMQRAHAKADLEAVKEFIDKPSPSRQATDRICSSQPAFQFYLNQGRRIFRQTQSV